MEKHYNTNFNYTDDFNNTDYSSQSIMRVVELIVICTGLPLMLVAICAVYCLARKDHSAPVYIINLLISDLIQLCCLTAWWAGKFHDIIVYSYTFALMASVGFMVCISLERYLVIAKPLWYRFRRNIKTSLIVCAVVWTLALVSVLPHCFAYHQVVAIIYAAFFFLPIPLFIFFLVATIKALSAARSVPAEEKRRIVSILVAVLLIYTLLFLPNSIWSFMEEAKHYHIFTSFACICFYLSPLADLTMYFCIRKSAMDNFLKLLCCCSMSDNQETSSTAVENMSALSTETV